MKYSTIKYVLLSFMLFFVCASCAQSSQIINGNLISVEKQSIKIDTGSSTKAIDINSKTKLTRGQIGKEPKSVTLRDFAPGDRILVELNKNNIAVSAKASFGIIKGIVAKIHTNSFTLKDGRSIKVSPSAKVSLSDGSIGKLTNVKSGTQIVGRVNPITGVCWMIISEVTEKNPAVSNKRIEPAKVDIRSASKNKQAQLVENPEITSITYIIKNGILYVCLVGTPGGNATIEVKDLIPQIQLTEEKLGTYKTVVKIPDNTFVSDAPLLGRLIVNGNKAIPIQASKLITISKKDEVKPQVILAADKADTKQQSASVLPSKAAIILTNPPDNAKIRQAILIRGKAEPDSTVTVIITYSNNMTGILKLSGQVASQNISVDKNGDFRMGPIALEGPMATPGLVFTIKAYYSDSNDHSTAMISVVGNRE